MSETSSKNLGASVHQRLLNLSKKRNEDFNLMLTRYGVERLLYRLTRSPHADKFVLKGAMLLAIWIGQSHRPTRDLDLLGYGEASSLNLEHVFQQVCQVQVEDDGLVFEAKSVTAVEIRVGAEYPGQRVKLTAQLGSARIRMQIDVGFGDSITPEAVQIEYPGLLDFPTPRIRAYPRETVVAEKLEAMVQLGMVNSRMKDFYDLHLMCKMFSFTGFTLVQAIRATFIRRGTKIPSELPVALSDELATDPGKTIQWNAFLTRSGLENTTVSFSQLVDELRTFLAQPLDAASYESTFKLNWPAGGPWSEID